MYRKLIIFLTIVGVIALLAATAFAQGPGRRGGDGDRGQGMRPVFGKILSISADSITVEPMIPQEMLDRMAENGRELPDLPDEITVGIDDSTQFYFDSAEASASAFSVGDEIVIVASGKDNPMAKKVADPATAREYLKNKMGNRGGGQGMRGGQGNRGGGQDGRGQGGNRGAPPVFGEITAMNGDSATIRIELPDFILERMQESGREMPADLPSEVTVTLGDKMRFAQNSEQVDENPFGVGDMVVVVVRRGGGDTPVAFLMADWASAEARMGQGMGGRGVRDGSGSGCEPGEDGDEDGAKQKRRRPNRKSR